MFIRFEDYEGIGIFRSDYINYHHKFRNLFVLLGAITRSPTAYRGMEPGHECRGVDHEFQEHINPNTRFAWKLEFFLDVVRGYLTPTQQDTLCEIEQVGFLEDDQDVIEFLTELDEAGVVPILINGPVKYETEQQVIFEPKQMFYIDQVSVDDYQLFSVGP